MARNKPRRSSSTFGIAESMKTASPEPADEVSTAPVAAPAEERQDDRAAAPTPATDPAAVPADTQPRAAPTRKSTVARKSAPVTSDRGVAALEGRHPTGGGGATPAAAHPDASEVTPDYATPAWHPRMKDPTASTSTELIDEIEAVQAEWTAANRARLSGRKQPPPTTSGFREALLRLGLKHLNDPEFIELIPPDARRKQRR